MINNSVFTIVAIIHLGDTNIFDLIIIIFLLPSKI